MRDLGAAAAFYLETTLRPNDVVGISSWSAALLAMVEAMHPSPRPPARAWCRSSAASAILAPRSTRRSSPSGWPTCLAGTATLLPAPGVVGSADAQTRAC